MFLTRTKRKAGETIQTELRNQSLTMNYRRSFIGRLTSCPVSLSWRGYTGTGNLRVGAGPTETKRWSKSERCIPEPEVGPRRRRELRHASSPLPRRNQLSFRNRGKPQWFYIGPDNERQESVKVLTFELWDIDDKWKYGRPIWKYRMNRVLFGHASYINLELISSTIYKNLISQL